MEWRLQQRGLKPTAAWAEAHRYGTAAAFSMSIPLNASNSIRTFRRNRLLYALCMAGVVMLGLVWRSSWLSLPPAVAKYGGDALWSLFVFLGFGLLLPRWSTCGIALLALVFSFAAETSQLWHPAWLDAVRQTRLGALALGSVFDWPDLFAYAIGIGIGAGPEWGLRRMQHAMPA